MFEKRAIPYDIFEDLKIGIASENSFIFISSVCEKPVVAIIIGTKFSTA